MAFIDVLNQLDDETVLNIIRKGLFVDNTNSFTGNDVNQPKSNEPHLKILSNSITLLQNEFNKIYSYTLNVKNLGQFNLNRKEIVAAENALEDISEYTSKGHSYTPMDDMNDTFDALSDTIAKLGKSIENMKVGGSSGIIDNLTDNIDAEDVVSIAGMFTKYAKMFTIGGAASIIGEGLDYFGYETAGAWGKLLGTTLTGTGAGGLITKNPYGALVGGIAGFGYGVYDNWGKFGVHDAIFTKAGAATIDPNVARLNSKYPSSYENIEAERRLIDSAAKSVNPDRMYRPISENSYSHKFATYLDTTINNLSSWSTSVSPLSTGSSYGGGGGYSDSGELTPDSSVLDAIAKAEGTYNTGYNTSLGHGRFLPNKTEHNLVGMTLNEILELGYYMRRQPKNPNSSALGRYQIVGSTLKDAAKALNLDLNTTRFDQKTQDRLAMWIVQKQGFRAWEGFKKHRDYLEISQNSLRNNNIGMYGESVSGTVDTGTTSGIKITSQAGDRHGRQHQGIDVIPSSASGRTTIAAGVTGTVVFRGSGRPYTGYGNVVNIRGNDGLYYLYAHLDTISSSVMVGRIVNAGDIIGIMGNTGNSRGAHLHFEIRRSELGGQLGNQYLIPFINSHSWVVGGKKDGEQMAFGKNTGVMVLPSDKNIEDVAARQRAMNLPFIKSDREEAQRTLQSRGSNSPSNSGGSNSIKKYYSFDNIQKKNSMYFN